MNIIRRIYVLANDHYIYNGQPIFLTSTKQHQVWLRKGDKFSLRPNKNNTIRFINKSTGLVRVFALDKNIATNLINSSKPA